MADPTERVLQLLSMLQTYKFWSGAELAERLGVTDRTLRRDIDRLRGLGYPVDSSPGATGGYRLASGSHMPPLLLDDDEAVAIAVGLRAAASASVDGIEDTAIRAMAKLEQVLPDRLRRRVNALHSNVSSLRWGDGQGPTVDPEALALLAQACRDREEVRFEYERRDGEQMRRLVQPQQLVSTGRRWYLVAWDVRRDDWRTFRVDRVSSPALAGVRFAARALPDGMDAAAWVEQSIGSMPRAFETFVVVHGDEDEVREAVRWTDSTVEAVDPSMCRVHTRAESLDWVVATVAQIAVAFDLEVEGPPEVADRVAAVAARLAGGA